MFGVSCKRDQIKFFKKLPLLFFLCLIFVVVCFFLPLPNAKQITETFSCDVRQFMHFILGNELIMFFREFPLKIGGFFQHGGIGFAFDG